MELDRAENYRQLEQLLYSYGHVAVAFSGGIDSTLIVKAACDTLGPGKVLALFARSSLLKAWEIERVFQWSRQNGCEQGRMQLEVVDWEPLNWKEFVRNGSDRCYRCKFRMYKIFLERMEQLGITFLLDGTNTDDLKTHRPGLQAIRELGVKTPLVDAGIDKATVRILGRRLRLSNWDFSPSSCLATRIPTGLAITRNRLQLIERLEEELAQIGLVDCRVRLEDAEAYAVSLAVDVTEFDTMMHDGIRSAIVRRLKNHGVGRVLLDLEGR